jgi:hypothetical protein
MAGTIISASRRTDIPHYFSRWFGERRRAGFAEFRNSFGGAGRVSLRNEDVLGYLFWTKYAKPFARELEALRRDGVAYAFQYTITGLGGTPVEAHVPPTHKAIADFVAIRSALPSSDCIEWRYDPIALSDAHPARHHLETFASIARELRGATRVVNVSFVEPFLKSIRRMAGHPSLRYRRVDPARHRTTATRYPDLPEVPGAVALRLLDDLRACAGEYGIELRVCSQPELEGVAASQCCGTGPFLAHGGDVARRVRAIPSAPSRSGCRCLKSVDIGMDNTCVSGCSYCYAVVSHASAVQNRARHDPRAAMLRRGRLDPP